jgi:nucleotidyltransferase substrate binding protein (TIGR01987 family)
MSDLQKLDLSSLVKAATSLEEAVVAQGKDTDNKFIRDAAIQRFKYTYELAHKMLKRYLEMSEPNSEEIDQMSFPNLIRTGSEKGLMLNGWDVWKIYRDARNITSHTYNENKAIQVYTVIPRFLVDTKHLLAKLQERISQG